MQDDGAGAGQDDGQPGSGAPGGGSPEGGSDNDEKPITAKQLKAALESQRRHYEGQIEQQRAEFDAFKAGANQQRPAKEDNAPKRYSRKELNDAVTAGRITQEQADDHWAQQTREEAREDAVAAATAAVAGRTTKERIDSDLAAYKRLKPEIMEAGTERDKIREEFKYLVSIGKPNDISTELAAIRAVLGPLDKLQNAASARRSAETEQQGGGGDSKPVKTGKKLVDQMDARGRTYYEHAIKQGRYKDWDAVEAELKFAPPQSRARLGIRA